MLVGENGSAMITGPVEQGSQVLLATHSPVLAAVPGALIVELDTEGMTPRTWDQLDLGRDWTDFLAVPRR